MDVMGVSTDDTAASQRTEGVDTDMSDDSCDQEREQAGNLKLPSCVFNLCSCKVLEHIMDHVDLHKILVFFQHGFCSKHRCETQLVNTIEDLTKGLNNRQQLDLLILDFSKVFDLNALKHLSKLQYCGKRDQTLTWIKNWLTGCTQCVVVDRIVGRHSNTVGCLTGYSARPLNVHPIHK